MLLLIAACLSADAVRVEPEDLGRRYDGQMIVVDDVVSSVLGPVGRRQVRLRRCPQVLFEFEGESPKQIEGNVRLTGRAEAVQGSLSVAVQRVELLPSDGEVYDQRGGRIAPGDAQAWYELSKWALDRHRLYDVEAMKEKGEEAYRRGLSEERVAAAGDPEKLLALRARLLEQRIVKSPDLLDLDHEILRARWSARPPRTADELGRFAEQVATTLDPERSALPPPIDASLAKEYQEEPLPAFRSASPAQRRSLARFWEIEVLRHALEQRVRKGERTEYEAGDWAFQHLRDYPKIALGWIERGVERDEGRLSELSPKQVEFMADRVRLELAHPARAADLQDRWLKARWKLLLDNEKRAAQAAARAGRTAPPLDARARHELASLSLSWEREDKEALAWAVELLKQAAEIEPSYQEPRDKLRSLGYRRSADGAWLSPESADDPKRREAGPPTVSVGMAPGEVEKILGRRDSETTTWTAAGVEMIWTYRSVSRSTFVLFRGRDEASFRVLRPPITLADQAR